MSRAKKITFEDFIAWVKEYNPDEVKRVKKAYDFAEECHRTQTRASGEPYIIHPLAVAYSLAQRKCDGDTLCAALLHDVIEDCGVSKEQLASEFGASVANLVDGVTNFRKVDFSSEDECDLANIRKLMESINDDPRIILIKLADRLHNMETLKFIKDPTKRYNKAKETMDIFVPLARHMGANWLADRLEDLSFKYLNPQEYEVYEVLKNNIYKSNNLFIEQMKDKIKKALEENGIECELYISYKNIYSLYNQVELQKENINNIKDLVSIKIVLKTHEIEKCYEALNIISETYKLYGYDIQDSIKKPILNMYQSLDVPVYGLMAEAYVCIRTEDMHLISEYGLVSSWEFNKGLAKYAMKEDLKNFPFYQILEQIISKNYSDQEFMNKLKADVFGSSYVYTRKSNC